MNKHLNIEEAIKLANKKTTTLNTLCKFIYKDIQAYQDDREEFYLEEFRDRILLESPSTISDEIVEQHTNELIEKIQRDTQKFSVVYATEAIDRLLDLMNDKRCKNKHSVETLLILLSSLKDIFEEEN